MSWCNTGCNLKEGNENATGLTTPTTALAISPKPARNPKFPNNTNTHTGPLPHPLQQSSYSQKLSVCATNCQINCADTVLQSPVQQIGNPLPHSLRNPESDTKCNANQSLERDTHTRRGDRNLCVVAKGSVLAFSSEQGHMGNGSLFYRSHVILLLTGAVNSMGTFMKVVTSSYLCCPILGFKGNLLLGFTLTI